MKIGWKVVKWSFKQIRAGALFGFWNIMLNISYWKMADLEAHTTGLHICLFYLNVFRVKILTKMFASEEGVPATTHFGWGSAAYYI